MLSDIRNYVDTNTLLPILVGASVTDTIGLFIWRYTADKDGPINKWYNIYGIVAYIIDILSIIIGIVLTQLITTAIGGPWNPVMFCAVAVAVQMFHDTFFGKVVLDNFPKNKNSIMDLLKEYADKSGSGILIVDAIYMIVASLIAMVLFKQKRWISWFILLWTFYTTGYVLYTQ